MSPPPDKQEDKVELTATGKLRRKRARTVTGCKTCRTRRVKCDEKRVSWNDPSFPSFEVEVLSGRGAALERLAKDRRAQAEPSVAHAQPKCTNCSRHPLRKCEYEFDVEVATPRSRIQGRHEVSICLSISPA